MEGFAMKFTKDEIRKSMLLYAVTDRAWLKENVSKSKMAPAVCSTPRAAAVAELGAKKWREGKAINADDHRPIYLKKSQAEQEREAGIYTKGSLRPGESGTQAKIC